MFHYQVDLKNQTYVVRSLGLRFIGLKASFLTLARHGLPCLTLMFDPTRNDRLQSFDICSGLNSSPTPKIPVYSDSTNEAFVGDRVFADVPKVRP